MSDSVAEEIKKKILRERNIITGASNLKKKTSNAAVIQKCNTNIQEAQQNIDYLNETLNQLKFQDEHSEHSIGQNTSDEQTLNDQSGNNGVKKTTDAGNYSRLDLIKYDCPSLGQRIQYMINQLNTKLKVEQKYYEANEKLSKIYQLDGDRRISSVAEDGRVQSNHKIQLLKKSLKRYEDIHVNLDQLNEETDPMNNVKFRRKPLGGTLTIGISSIRDVDHIASPMFSRKTESYISIKVDDDEKAKTKGSRNDRWSEEFNIHVDKGNEVEITVYDKIGNQHVPVAMAWFLVSDIAEEIRKKKVGQSGVGWVSAARIQNGRKIQNPNVNNDNFTLNERENTSNGDSKEPIRSSSWYILEPSGQILLTIGFSKSTTPNKKTLLGGLHRHGAIRKRDEEVYEQHGHQFVQKQFYSIMRCALCAEFLPYNGYQCQDCKFLCHKKCYQKVITKCISKSSTDIDPDELKLNHRIPHRFEHVSNRGTNWCCHCGNLLPWGRKNVLKCCECDIMCHTSCSHLVPDFCGMSMETANKILSTIKSTEGIRKKQPTASLSSARSTTSTTVHTLNERPTPTSVQPSYIQPPQEGKVKLPSLPPSVSSQVTPEYDIDNELPTQSLNQKQEQAVLSPQRQRRPPPPADGHYSRQPSAQEQASLADEEDQKIQQQLQQQHQLNLQLQKEAEAHEEQRRQVEEQRYYQEQQLYIEQQQQLEERRRQIQEEQSLRQQQDLYNRKDVADHSNRQSLHSQISAKLDPRQSLESDRSHDGLATVDTHDSTPRTDKSQSLSQKDKRHRQKVGLDDFNFLAVLGRGNFGKVMLARSYRNKNLCAVKVLKKDMIIENGEIASMNAEKEVFLVANQEQHPFLINLHCCFQTANRIYFVMEYVPGGDLMWHVQQATFSQRRAKFYAAEVLLALEHLHKYDIIYRDLKLDNIMLSTDGHIKIADYGLCKHDMGYGKTTNTFCGTPEFMAPEILREQHYTRAVDWWAFGVLLYQMLLGKSPFRGEDEDEVFNAILTDEPLFPIQMASEAVGLLESLLNKDPVKRLGSGPTEAQEIKEHAYFRNINFDDILHLRVPPPYVPEVKAEDDVSFFDKDFTTEVPRLTPVNSVLDSSTQAQFRGFSYVSDASGLVPK
ncbi:classical protein kinase C [Wickerhamomyces ciferrii]|uniref:protein kinase C n=1 Tax=Wickerhamomyces ciferrii (strain ATCC 14091 / BCRC 22168 / CBS 111 / JCM 3599 / NBRC 0793 / NRRL Y-1031 F-60-10) TaxID=1206466 RepID=K0KV84_WICCF|nr:classical protein kinase C [Wickerhamomyces ciferrii]CCH45344.1 classical protein kinase C [Wickerhamomyces ciferrii]